MTGMQRVKSILGGLITIALSIILFHWPDSGITVIGTIISITMMVTGIGNLVFYFTMSRHMVGGKNALYTGVILFDLGLFAFTVNISQVYIILYLLGIHAFSGAVDIMLALNARKLESSAWRLNFLTGLGNIAIAVAAIVYGFVLNNGNAIVEIYAAGLLYTGILRIVNALRSTSIVYIQ